MASIVDLDPVIVVLLCQGFLLFVDLRDHFVGVALVLLGFLFVGGVACVKKLLW